MPDLMTCNQMRWSLMSIHRQALEPMKGEASAKSLRGAGMEDPTFKHQVDTV